MEGSLSTYWWEGFCLSTYGSDPSIDYKEMEEFVDRWEWICHRLEMMAFGNRQMSSKLSTNCS